MPPGTRRRRRTPGPRVFHDMLNAYLPADLLREEVSTMMREMTDRMSHELIWGRPLGTPRDDSAHQSVISQLRPYQEEINRVSQRMAEQQAVLGESTLRIRLPEGSTIDHDLLAGAYEQVRVAGVGQPEQIYFNSRAMRTGRMSSSARNQQSMRRPKAHLKMRDGWTKTIPLPENYGRRLVLPFASASAFGEGGSDTITRRDFEPVREVTTLDLRTGYSVKDVWFEER